MLPNPRTGQVDDITLHCWDIGHHHFEQEIFTDGHIELFYWNQETNEMFDCEYQSGEDFPAEFRSYLEIAHNELLKAQP